MVAPLVQELREVKASLTALSQRPEGVITTHQAEELRRAIGILARDLVDLGDHPTMKAARGSVQQQVMGIAGWGGTGHRRYLMPASA